MTAEEYFEKGKEFYNKGEYKKAIKCYNEALQKDSFYLDAYFDRGRVKRSLKDYKGAIKDYDIVYSIVKSPVISINTFFFDNV